MSKMTYTEKSKLFGRIISFVIVLVLIITVVFGGFLATLAQWQEWSNHSGVAQSSIEVTQKAFSDADYKGRSLILKGGDRSEVDLNRAEAFSKVEKMKAKISDNPEQIKTAKKLIDLMSESFELQDVQIASVQKTGNRISYDAETVNKRIEITGAIESAFFTLKINEHDLLEFDRQPKIVSLQWVIATFGFIVFIFIVAGLITILILHRDLLKRLGSAAEKVDAGDKRKAKYQEFLEWLETDEDAIPT